MRSCAFYFFAAFTVILTLYIQIIPVKGQSTLHDCENAGSSISIVEDIGLQQLFVQAIRKQLSEHDQRIHETLNSSFQEIKNQQDTVMTSLQVIDRRSQEQDFCIKQVQSMHELINASIQQQLTSVLRRLDEVMELLLDHGIFVKNQSQNSCTPTIALTSSTETPLPPTSAPCNSDLLPVSNNWTVIMSRCGGSPNFNRSWTEYKNGFGEIGHEEFWLGNEEVHRLTNRRGVAYSLRVEVQPSTSGNWFYAEYSTISLDSENNGYVLRVSGYSGNAGNSLLDTSVPSGVRNNGMRFSTYDVDHDAHSSSCAQYYGGGWWFNNCFQCCLTCTSSGWFQWAWSGGWQTSGALRAARMMIKIK